MTQDIYIYIMHDQINTQWKICCFLASSFLLWCPLPVPGVLPQPPCIPESSGWGRSSRSRSGGLSPVVLHSCSIRLPFSHPWVPFAAQHLFFWTNLRSLVGFLSSSLPFSVVPLAMFFCCKLSYIFGVILPFCKGQNCINLFVRLLYSTLWRHRVLWINGFSAYQSLIIKAGQII